MWMYIQMMEGYFNSSSPVYCVSPLMPEKRSLSSQYLYCPLDISNEEGKLVLRV
jgi:hypothetical protein